MLLLAGLAAALIWRLATEPVPPLAFARILPARVRLPGKPFTPAWPREGQAAVEVEGVGSLGPYGSRKPAPIASVAKMMTAYLTLRAHPLAPGQEGFTVRISGADVADEHERVALDQSVVAVRRGERLSERQALEALLLPSANNVAALLAIHEAGSIPAFVRRMNATARRLGMTSTTYTDPSGFEPTTVSTAADQLKLVRLAMRIPAFAAIVSKPSVRLPVAGRVINYNGLVGSHGYVGVKTGSDDAAGGCLVFAKRVRVGGRRLLMLGVVLGQRQEEYVPASLASAFQLGESVAAGLRMETVLPAGAPVLTATNASGGRAAVLAAAPLRAAGWPGLRVPVRVLAAGRRAGSLSEGERVGTVGLHGRRAPRVGAVAAQGLGGPSLSWRLLHLF